MCNYPGIYDPQTVTQRGTRVRQNKNRIHGSEDNNIIIFIILLYFYIYVLVVAVVPKYLKRKSHWYYEVRRADCPV